MNDKARIFWLTGDYFFDVDLPVVSEISKNYKIDWHILSGYNFHYNEPAIMSTSFPDNPDIQVYPHKSKTRMRSPKRIMEYMNLIKSIKQGHYSVVYIAVMDLYLMPLLLWFRIKNVVYACHDFKIHVGFENGRIFSLNQKLIFNLFNNFQLFSKEQYRLFKNDYPSKNAFVGKLALKDFGSSHSKPPEKKVVFTFFGTIRENKGLEYLIRAGNELSKTHKGKFIIKIYGYTKDPEKYITLVEDPESFYLDFREIPSEEIADIFCSSHFLVLPYLDVTQSGPLLIAYNYNLPAIASDLPGFREYIEDGANGFLFKRKDFNDLSAKMAYVIDHNEDYAGIKLNLESFIKENCSLKSISNEYLNFFSKFRCK